MRGTPHPPIRSRGFTLLELVVVIVLIGILTSIAVRGLDYSFQQAKCEATQQEMELLGRAMVGDPRLVSAGVRTDFGFVGDMGRFPATLDELVTSPGGNWRGPYVRSSFSEDTTGFKEDAWGNAYDYPHEGDKARLMSTAGGDTLTYLVANDTTSVLANTVRGTVTDSTGSPPSGAQLDSVIVKITRPVNGTLTTSEVNPIAGGTYEFTDLPIGNHRMSAVYTTNSDSVVQFVAVTPGSSPIVNFRFPSSF